MHTCALYSTAFNLIRRQCKSSSLVCLTNAQTIGLFSVSLSASGLDVYPTPASQNKDSACVSPKKTLNSNLNPPWLILAETVVSTPFSLSLSLCAADYNLKIPPRGKSNQ